MSEYQVLARKFRPQAFRDVVGQEAIVATLKNALTFKQTAHAYLFCGGRGTGKTTLARLFAKALNCQKNHDNEPCNECPSCRAITSCHSMDVLEIDGASHRGIEDVRQINETIGFVPTCGHYKIYLIDEVHMLTKEAFNALLKTLEEPPAHVKFFFCTTEPHKIPATILSRCQRFNLLRINPEMICQQLSVILGHLGHTFEPSALHMIAQRSEGSLRDALSLLDQLLAFEKNHVTAHSVATLLGLPSKELFFELTTASQNYDLVAAFNIAKEVFISGKSLSYFIEELIAYFRTLLLLKHGVACQASDAASYEQAANCYRTDQLVHILELLQESQQNLKSAPSERTFLEILLLQIVRTHRELTLETLVERLLSLEQRLEEGSPKELRDASSFKGVTTPMQNVPPTPPSLPLPPAAPITPTLAKTSEALSIKEQSRFDTIMRFAAKELNGSLKKE